ncbi:MAG: glycogen debranching enzyme, partial [Polyangiaceae bacterium]
VHDEHDSGLYLMFNASPDAAEFRVAAPPSGAGWRLAVDTSREAPNDFYAPGAEPQLEAAQTYAVGPHSSVVLVTR